MPVPTNPPIAPSSSGTSGEPGFGRIAASVAATAADVAAAMLWSIAVRFLEREVDGAALDAREEVARHRRDVPARAGEVLRFEAVAGGGLLVGGGVESRPRRVVCCGGG